MHRVRALTFPVSQPSSSAAAVLLATLSLLGPACAVVPSKAPAQDAASAHSAPADKKADASGVPDAAATPGAKSDKADVAEKIEKKEQELACARLELDIARQSIESEESAARASVVESDFKLLRAKQDRDNFKNVEAQLTTSESDLRLEEAKERLEESRQELAELEKMYKQESFAEITKELVLVRGKVKVKMAEKGLELTQKKAVQQREFEIPKKLAELEQAIQKASEDQYAALSKEARLANEKKLKILKAEQAIGDIERSIAKLKSGKDEKNEKDVKS
jgi:hypothetical protein